MYTKEETSLGSEKKTFYTQEYFLTYTLVDPEHKRTIHQVQSGISRPTSWGIHSSRPYIIEKVSSGMGVQYGVYGVPLGILQSRFLKFDARPCHIQGRFISLLRTASRELTLSPSRDGILDHGISSNCAKTCHQELSYVGNIKS